MSVLDIAKGMGRRQNKHGRYIKAHKYQFEDDLHHKLMHDSENGNGPSEPSLRSSVFN